MAGDGGMQQLPSALSTLCFNKDEFMKENFSIDKFVSECRKHVPLETLREDLGIYLRLLRAAMIELINQDYADFVNLSSNLVGLDKAITKLSVPLGQFKEEVQAVKSAVDESVHLIENKLRRHKFIRDKKTSLQLLMSSVNCMERVENMLKIKTSIGDNNCSSYNELNLDGNMMEKIATEFNQLQFVVARSKGLVLIEKLKPRILQITTVLQKNLEKSFLRSLNANDLAELLQCLRIYAAIDKVKDAEELYRKRVVAPYMESIINEKLLRFNPQGLIDIYARILEFIPKYFTSLKGITDATFSENSANEFDFLVNSVWPEIVSCIEIRMPILCDVTDPDAFHERYNVTLDFLEKFENECGSAKVVMRLREHESYKRFLNKWNIAVYFQIRFQEIGSALELQLQSPHLELEKENKDKKYLLIQTNSLWSCMYRCWSSEVLLPPLIHKFWKLTLLLLSRYEKWANEAIEMISQDGYKELGAPSSSMHNVEHLESRAVNGLNSQSMDTSSASTCFMHTVALASDIHGLLQNIPQFVTEIAFPHIVSLATNKIEALDECTEEIRSTLMALLPRIGQTVIDILSVQCCPSLKSVFDIPRLFRRTNREVPTKPSAYVSNSLKPLEAFLEKYDHLIPPTCRKKWIRETVVNICSQYLAVTSEVLTSVRKMEDSLKRLKKARDKPLTTAVSGITDDDKIRLQLALDVEHFGKQLKALSIEDETSIPSFHQLIELVESERSSPSQAS